MSKYCFNEIYEIGLMVCLCFNNKLKMDNVVKKNLNVQMKKRKRNKNWDDVEKALLKECVAEHMRAVENRSSDTNTLVAKREAWKLILMKFNTLNDNQRDLSQVQAQWKMLKLACKANLSRYRREVMATGVGPQPPSPSQDIYFMVDVLPNEFVVDDSDSTFKAKLNFPTQTLHSTLPHSVPKRKLSFEETASSSKTATSERDMRHSLTEVSSEDDIPPTLPSPPPLSPHVSPHTVPLHTGRPPRRRPFSKEDNFDDVKMKISEETIKIMHLEHKKKMECMVRLMEDESRANIRLKEDESRANIRLREIESQTRVRLMEEEHNVKMLMLKDQCKNDDS